MTTAVPIRVMACSGVEWSALRQELGSTTARWRDKKARCAREDGRGFSIACEPNSRGAPCRRSLRPRRSLCSIRMLARCAELWL